jgi:hydroxyacylglutathione hydrolase
MTPGVPLVITPVAVGAFVENSYLVVDPATRRAVFVDPGAEGERLVAMVHATGATLEAIWLTHAHVDHVGGIGALKRAFPDAPIHLHPLDRPLYAAAADVAEMYGMAPFDPPPPPDQDLAEGQTITLGDTKFDVLHVPGHAPGHVIFVGPDVVFAGDLLFAGSVGRTDLPYANKAQMTASLRRIAALPGHFTVHSGHGPATTIAAEKRTNPFLSK